MCLSVICHFYPILFPWTPHNRAPVSPNPPMVSPPHHGAPLTHPFFTPTDRYTFPPFSSSLSSPQTPRNRALIFPQSTHRLPTPPSTPQFINPLPLLTTTPFPLPQMKRALVPSADLPNSSALPASAFHCLGAATVPTIAAIIPTKRTNIAPVVPAQPMSSGTVDYRYIRSYRVWTLYYVYCKTDFELERSSNWSSYRLLSNSCTLSTISL